MNKHKNSNMYVYGDQNVKVPAHIHFGKYLLDHVRKINGDRIALVDGNTGQTITFKEFTQLAVNMASELMKLGIGRGDVVALGSESRNDLGPAILAVLLAGATFTVYDIFSGEADVVKHKVSVARPNFFIISKAFWEKYGGIVETAGGVKMIMTLDEEPASVVSIKSLIRNDVDVEAFEPLEVKGQTDVAFILYSSGTTGMPKGISLTHLSCIINSAPYNLDYSAIHTVLSCGEWDMTFTMYKLLNAGITSVYLCVDILDGLCEKIIKCIHNYKVNMVLLLPHLVIGLYKTEVNDDICNLNSLYMIYTRAAPLHIRVIENIKKRFPSVQKVLQSYGMTECGELCSETLAIQGSKPGSVGVVCPGVILKVVDPKTGNVLGPNERGEIRAKGPVVMKGYIDVDPTTYLDEEGFLKTGDWGYYDENEYFYIVDRINQFLSYNVLKISPLQLETIIQLHPDVMEAAVVGKSDEIDGDVPTAFVVLKPGAKVTEQELIEYVAAETPSHMNLAGGVKFIKTIPRNPHGKIIRHALSNLLKQGI